MYDEKEMRGAIRRKGYRKSHVALELGISYQTLYKKLKGESQFTARDMGKMRDRLGFTADEIEQIFFDGGTTHGNGETGTDKE